MYVVKKCKCNLWKLPNVSAVLLELSFLTVLFNPLGKSHHDPIYEAIMMENMGVAKLKMLIPLVARKTFWNSGTVYRLDSNVTIMRRNDELSLKMSWVGCLLTD